MEEETQEAPAQRKAARVTRHRLLLSGSVLLVVVAIGVGLFMRPSGPPSEFVKLQKTVSFPIYYSKKLPTGLSLDKKSLSSATNVVIYSFTYEKGAKRLSLSVQPLDASLDTTTFRPTSEFSTHIGRAYIVDLDDRTSAAVVGDKSWVLISAPNKIADDTLKDLINSLEPVQP
ncbi:MAG: hypothetical protein ABWY71_00955 [Candidatus Saccharimonadales bacterium]